MKKSDRIVYQILDRLQSSDGKGVYNESVQKRFSATDFHRALRIHKHLKALVKELVEHEGQAEVSFGKDPGSDQVILSIQHKNIRCRRTAYLSRREFSLLKKNQRVSHLLVASRSSSHAA